MDDEDEGIGIGGDDVDVDGIGVVDVLNFRGRFGSAPIGLWDSKARRRSRALRLSVRCRSI